MEDNIGPIIDKKREDAQRPYVQIEQRGMTETAAEGHNSKYSTQVNESVEHVQKWFCG